MRTDHNRPVEVIYQSRSVSHTHRIGAAIGRSLQGGEVVALVGELGTGKTALVRGIAAGLGAPPRAVSSPTFVLVHEYHGRIMLAHADLYRLESSETVSHLGLEDYFNPSTAVAIEWADRAPAVLPSDRLDIALAHTGNQARRLCFVAKGPRAALTLARIQTDLAKTSKGRRRTVDSAGKRPPT